MKLTRGGTTEFNESDGFEGYEAGVTKKNLGKMFAVTSKNMYRRPIQSIVREITSNCFDSHIEAKVDDPVIIKINFDEGGDYILFKDVGIGISEERMKNVYANWFESTKEEKEDEIGMWGLGSKSPLAYTSSFYLTTCYNGKKWEYCVREGIDKPRIDILIEDETEERNGTEVKIYIKNTSDLSAFFQACKSELLYFDNVVLDTYIQGFNNEYSILEYNTFKYRPDVQYSQQLHLIIGKVPYPINWDDLGRKPINIPFGLQFKIGDLQVTPERESIRYIDIELPDGTTISTKEVINKKINECIAEVSKLYNDTVVNEFEDYEEYKRYLNNKQAIVTLDTYRVDVTELVKKKEGVFIPLKDFKGVIPTNLFYEYKTKLFYERGRKARSMERVMDHNMLIEYLCITMPVSKELSAKKVQYLYDYAYELTGKSCFYIVDKDHYSLKSYLRLFNIKNDYSEDKQVILTNYSETNLLKQFKLIINFIRSEFRRLAFRYEDIQITPEWIQRQKEEKAKVTGKKENSFLVYNYGNINVSDNKEYVLKEDLAKFTGFIIYGFDEDEELLKEFRILLGASKYSGTHANIRNRYTSIDSKKCRLYKTAKRNEKHLIDVPSASYIYDFMGEHKVFKKFATAAMIEGEGMALDLTGYPGHSNSNCMNFREMMEYIFPPFSEKLKELGTAMRDFGSLAFKGDNKVSDKFFKDLITIAHQYNLYDKEMYESHEKLERYVKGLELVNFIVLNLESLEYFVDFLKLQNKKISDVWLSLEDYERSLIQDSKEKLAYLNEVYNSSFVGKGNFYYSSIGRDFKCQAELRRDQADKLLQSAKKNIEILNLLIKYHEKRGKAIAN